MKTDHGKGTSRVEEYVLLSVNDDSPEDATEDFVGTMFVDSVRVWQK